MIDRWIERLEQILGVLQIDGQIDECINICKQIMDNQLRKEDKMKDG